MYLSLKHLLHVMKCKVCLESFLIGLVKVMKHQPNSSSIFMILNRRGLKSTDSILMGTCSPPILFSCQMLTEQMEQWCGMERLVRTFCLETQKMDSAAVYLTL